MGSTPCSSQMTWGARSVNARRARSHAREEFPEGAGAGVEAGDEGAHHLARRAGGGRRGSPAACPSARDLLPRPFLPQGRRLGAGKGARKKSKLLQALTASMGGAGRARARRAGAGRGAGAGGRGRAPPRTWHRSGYRTAPPGCERSRAWLRAVVVARVFLFLFLSPRTSPSPSTRSGAPAAPAPPPRAPPPGALRPREERLRERERQEEDSAGLRRASRRTSNSNKGPGPPPPRPPSSAPAGRECEVRSRPPRGASQCLVLGVGALK